MAVVAQGGMKAYPQIVDLDLRLQVFHLASVFRHRLFLFWCGLQNYHGMSQPLMQ